MENEVFGFYSTQWPRDPKADGSNNISLNKYLDNPEGNSLVRRKQGNARGAGAGGGAFVGNGEVCGLSF